MKDIDIFAYNLGGPVAPLMRDPQPEPDPINISPAQLANLTGGFATGSGIADIFGEYPAFPTDPEMTVAEMTAGPRGPSLLENIRNRELLDAGLQVAGGIGDLFPPAMAAIAPMRAARAASKAEKIAELRKEANKARFGDDFQEPSERIQRASRLGFNMAPEGRLYHASKQDITELKSFYPDGMIYTTPDPKFAENWLGKGKFRERQDGVSVKKEKERKKKLDDEFEEKAKGLSEDEILKLYDEEYDKKFQEIAQNIRDADKVIYPLVSKTKKPFVPHKDVDVLEEFFGSEKMSEPFSPADNMPTYKDGLKSGNFILYENKEMVNFLKGKGYDSMFLREDTVTNPKKIADKPQDVPYETFAVFDPTDLRSPFAKFDPDEIESPDILKAQGGAVNTDDIDIFDVSDMFDFNAYRKTGEPKSQSGWLGPIKNNVTGGTMTELSIGVEIGGQEVEIPSLVPTLNQEEINHLANRNPEGGLRSDNPVEKQIMRKAVSHALPFLQKGQTPFYRDPLEAVGYNLGGSVSEMIRNPTLEREELLTPEQAAYLATVMTVPGSGIADISGNLPSMPTAEDTDIFAGEPLPSLAQNIESGEYLDAALQALAGTGDAAAAIPLFGGGVRALLTAPRAMRLLQYMPDPDAISDLDRMLRSTRINPEVRQAVRSHPAVTRVVAQMHAIPETKLAKGYGTKTYFATRRFNIDGREVVGIDNALEQMYDKMKRLGWDDDRVPYTGTVKGGNKNPVATIILGPPASGKSMIANPLARKYDAAILDPDEVKKIMPEFADGIGSNATHVESKRITQDLRDLMIANRNNIVVPTVGAKPEKISRQIADYKKAGYKVNLVDVAVPADEALRRMLLRFLGSKKLIPPDYLIDEVGDLPSQTYNLLRRRGEADAYARIDNSVGLDVPKPLNEDTGDIFTNAQIRLRVGGR